MQVGRAQGQVVVHAQVAQADNGVARVVADPVRPEDRALRREAVEGARIFRDDVRREDGGDAADVVAQPVIAVGDEGKDDSRVALGEGVADAVDLDLRRPGGDDHDLRYLVHMRGKGVVRHFPDEEFTLAVLVEGVHADVLRNGFVPGNAENPVCSDLL